MNKFKNEGPLVDL